MEILPILTAASGVSAVSSTAWLCNHACLDRVNLGEARASWLTCRCAALTADQGCAATAAAQDRGGQRHGLALKALPTSPRRA